MNTRKLYSFGGTVVAQHETTGVTYLHGDQGGSVSVATRADGTLSSRQEFDPWGSVHSGNVAETTLDYTGQRRDDTGLLFYNARFYDPAIGRFIRADTIAPHRESPQSRNRYTYVLNNPRTYAVGRV